MFYIFLSSLYIRQKYKIIRYSFLFLINVLKLNYFESAILENVSLYLAFQVTSSLSMTWVSQKRFTYKKKRIFFLLYFSLWYICRWVYLQWHDPNSLDDLFKSYGIVNLSSDDQCQKKRERTRYRIDDIMNIGVYLVSLAFSFSTLFAKKHKYVRARAHVHGIISRNVQRKT